MNENPFYEMTRKNIIRQAVAFNKEIEESGDNTPFLICFDSKDLLWYTHILEQIHNKIILAVMQVVMRHENIENVYKGIEEILEFIAFQINNLKTQEN